MAPLAVSFNEILRRTTRTPLYVEPEAWTAAHLDALRVSGFDKYHTLQSVMGGGELVCDPKNAQLQDIVTSLGRQPPPDDHEFSGLLSRMSRQEVRKPKHLASGVSSVCSGWAWRIFTKFHGGIRGVPGWDYYDERNLPLQFGDDVVSTYTAFTLHGYPDRFKQAKSPEYPISFPILSTWLQEIENHPIPSYWSILEERAFKAKRRKSSKEAEIVSILIAMAQKQAEALRKDRLETLQNDPRVTVFRPAVLVMREDTVRFVRANISIRYLYALSNPSQPCSEQLVVEQTFPIKLSDDPIAVFLGINRLIDEYIGLMPFFSQRHPLGPDEANKSLSALLRRNQSRPRKSKRRKGKSKKNKVSADSSVI